MFTVYILQCNDGSYYIGCTNNLELRIDRHRQGLASDWTANRLPIKLVYSEEYEALFYARRREKQIKNWSRVKKEKLIKGEWIKL